MLLCYAHDLHEALLYLYIYTCCMYTNYVGDMHLPTLTFTDDFVPSFCNNRKHFRPELKEYNRIFKQFTHTCLFTQWLLCRMH